MLFHVCVCTGTFFLSDIIFPFLTIWKTIIYQNPAGKKYRNKTEQQITNYKKEYANDNMNKSQNKYK